MKYVLFLNILYFSLFLMAAEVKTFRFHVASEPMHVDPIFLNQSSGNYVVINLFRSYFSYDADLNFRSEGAEKCEWINTLKLTCIMKRHLKYANGQAILPEHYLNTLYLLLDSKIKSPNSELLLNLKNATKILNGERPLQLLGVKVIDQTIEFEFDKPDADFLHKLANPVLSPRQKRLIFNKMQLNEVDFSGPYKLTRIDFGKSLQLENNLNYDSFQRPKVEALVVEEDFSALQLFETSRLNLMRRLPTVYTPKYKSSPQFFMIPFLRFDYLGFGGRLQNNKALRTALSETLRYSDLKTLYRTKGNPGCVGLPENMVLKELCYSFNLTSAQKLVRSQKLNEAYEIFYSAQTSDENKKGMEWLQHSWKRNLKMLFTISPLEQGMFLNKLKEYPPDVFRKGLNLDRPTCLAAVENFTKDHPENYIRYNNKRYDQVVSQLAQELDQVKKKQLCQQALDLLMADHVIIPLGEVYYSMLKDNKFKGWTINALNQLDLRRLSAN